MTYDYTRRAYEDLIVVCIETGSGYRVIGCNERLEDFCGKLIIKHMNFEGNILKCKSINTTIKGDSSTLLYEIASEDLTVQDIYSEYIKIEFETETNIFENRYLLADIYEINKLKLKDANLRIVKATLEKSQIKMTLVTEHFARSVRINILDTRADYSDNYFEMDAYSDKEITVNLHNAIDIENTVIYIEGENIHRIILPIYTLLS